MSTHKPPSKIRRHKSYALSALDTYLESLICSPDTKTQDKADKISYWLEDYTKFLGYETKFDASKYPRYKKGQIIQVHLGFNIGSEEGGLHYAVVIENNNYKTSPTLNIVPLTSIKDTTDISKLRPDLGRVNLGNELFRLLSTKVSTLQATITNEINNLREVIASLVANDPKIQNVKDKIDQLEKQFDTLKRTKDVISKMKLGSIALVGQITTISKLRIYDPKDSNGVLSGIKLSNESIDKIDEAIRKLYIKDKTSKKE